MRMTTARILAATSSLFAIGLFAGRARAQGQVDVNPARPNVLFLVDNSGSMERMIDGSLPEDNAVNTCDVSNCTVNSLNTTCQWGTAPAAANRWNTLLQALTGTPVNGFHCISMPRTANTPFTNEYQINGVFPYDTGYYLNYHRAIAADTKIPSIASIPCTYAPGTLPGAANGAGVGASPKYGTGTAVSADAFPGNAIVTRPYGQYTVDQSAKTMSCQFGLNPDGALLIYQDLMRFALMTFDQDPGTGKGVGSGPPYSVLSPGAFDGMWSYYLNWGGGAGVTASGHPTGCAISSPFEVGARNPAAPPWEGRMVPFPPPADSDSTRQSQNQQIRSVLSATRPFGGTPIAGMFQDAKDYLWNDATGPAQTDAAIQCGNRPQYIVLLTDGAPNQDLRESCGSQDNPSAPCPYNMPETIVTALAAGNGATQRPVYTYVIGFAVSSGKDQSNVKVQCSTLDPVGTDCINPTAALAPCCELQKIAVAGAPPTPPGTLPTTPHAYFADTAGDLNAALADILMKISSNTTTRTTPSASPVLANATYATGSTTPNQSTFFSSFIPGHFVPSATGLAPAGNPFTGNIQRSRFLCSSGPASIDPNLGDDFRENLSVATGRNFIAFNPATAPSLDASATIRPFASATTPDTWGNYGGTTVVGSAATIVSAMPTPALGFISGTANSCQYTSTQGNGTPYLNDSQCAAMLLDFTLGQSYSGPSDFPFISRAGINAFGGVYHAVPAVVGPPGAPLHDDSYDVFRTSTLATTAGMAPVGAIKVRDTLVYAATTDGLLHAFWADVGKEQNNEEWAFLPPAVMPQLKTSYPASNVFLLDGSPIVKDVIWDRPQGSATDPNGKNPWRTTLVAGFGPKQVGYYALDVSNPVFTGTAATTEPDPTGPTFLWQLTKAPTVPPGHVNARLFGGHGATPAITQVAINIGGTVHEVGVAILPGGWDTPPVAPAGGAAGCARDATKRTLTPGPQDWNVLSGYKPRTAVQCWGAPGASGVYTDPVVGRSVTIVRLDTGEILATFMRKADAPATDLLFLANRIVDTPLDSPMTGTPAVFPAQVGADATKFFIGDQDGTIWRFDISSSDPAQWKGRLYFDLYNLTADAQNGAVGDWSGGQPIALPLVLSLDRTGSLVLHAASGSQDTFDLSGPNFLVSLTEKVQQAADGTLDMRSSVNWYMGSKLPGSTQLASPVMDVGERVSGPMVVFGSELHFTTYSAGASAAGASAQCGTGLSRLWGADFIHANGWSPPALGTPSLGGDIAPIAPWNHTTAFIPLSPPLGSGVVVPGVSVQQTTACVQVSAGSDLYVPGATHSSPTKFTAGSFALVAQAGASNGAGGVATVNVALPAPATATVIDSWATVTE